MDRIGKRLHVGTLAVVTAALALGACSEGAGETRAQDAPAQQQAQSQQTPQQQVLDLRGAGYNRGNMQAPISVVEFSDFGCPYCGKFARETYPEIHEEFVKTGKVRWKYVPFVMGMFPNGAESARAAECAGEQGDEGFWAMHDRLFERQREWKGTSDPEALFNRYAAELGLDEDRFAACYDENRREDRIRRHNAIAGQLGVRATPTFFINGYPVRGALPAHVFRSIFTEILEGPGGSAGS